MNPYLTVIWAGLLSFIILMYVVLDGFDLGIGILFPIAKDKTERDIMMNTVSPVWDGNETWLVFGGACLYGAFPVVYSTLLPIIYIPLMLMLAALIFRGVAFEFRFKANRSRFLWSIAFSAGSFIAAFMQGAILGMYLQGFNSLPTQQIVSTHDWWSPFSIMAGLAVVVGYALLGSTWLIAKTMDSLQQKMYKMARVLLVLMAAAIVLVSLWTPFADPGIEHRWFSFPNLIYLSPLPVLTAATILYTRYTLVQRKELQPFFCSIALFIFSYIGLCVSIWPYMIPHTISIWEAAAPANAQAFILVGAVILIPILLIYTNYSYRVFKGKVTSADEHY